MFSKNVRTVYLYLICLITLFMVVGGLISAIYRVAELVFPTNNYYRMNYTLRDLAYSLAFVIIPLPIYLYNWNVIKKDKKEIDPVENGGE